MAQLDFFMLEDETSAFLNYLLDQKCEFIPDLFYESREIRILDNLRSLTSYVPINRLFFIVNKIYSKYPLEMRQVKRAEGERFYLVQRFGGPTIDLFIPKIIIDEEAKRFISSGFLSIYPSIYTADKQEVKASSELKFFYSKVVSYVKRASYKLSTERRTYYISKGTLEEIKAGALPVGVSSSYINIFLEAFQNKGE